jgi:hypothetical protein
MSPEPMPFPHADDDDRNVSVVITDAATRTARDVVTIPNAAFFGNRFVLNGKWYYHVDEDADGSWRFVNH